MTDATVDLAALLDELRQVLVAERQALLAGGNPDRLNGVTERKLRLAAAIEAKCTTADAVPPDPETLVRLARYNQENAVICTAMLRHLSAALDTLRRHELHRSYKADGTERMPAAHRSLGAA